MAHNGMKPEIQALFETALRGGEYQQGECFLNKDGKLCAAGVLSELAVQFGACKKYELPWHDGGTVVMYYDEMDENGEVGEQSGVALLEDRKSVV